MRSIKTKDLTIPLHCVCSRKKSRKIMSYHIVHCFHDLSIVVASASHANKADADVYFGRMWVYGKVKLVQPTVVDAEKGSSALPARRAFSRSSLQYTWGWQTKSPTTFRVRRKSVLRLWVIVEGRFWWNFAIESILVACGSDTYKVSSKTLPSILF